VGHKIHPYGFRLGVIYPWKSNWYAGRDYAEHLHEDIWIRKHIRSRLTRAGISSIDIERKGDQIWVFIRTARPGIVIGRKGAEVDRLRKDIERYTKKRVDVKVEDMNQASSEVRPETDGALLAQGVAEQLAGRVAFRRAMRRARARSACAWRAPAASAARRWAAGSGTAKAASRCTRSAPRSTTAPRRRRRRSAGSA
jgi:small subunit ribosomal protein S3